MKTVLVYKSRLLPLSETFIREQAQALKNFKAILLGRSKAKNGIETPGIEQVLIKKHGFSSKISKYLWSPESKVKKQIEKLKPSLIHIHFATGAVGLWPSIRHLRIPIFISLHGYDINTYKEVWQSGRHGYHKKFFPRRLLKIAKNKNVTFIAVSEAIKQRAIEFGIPKEKIIVSYIGVNTSQFKPSGPPLPIRKRNILFIGRFVEKKAPILLIEAFAKVKASVTDAELTMIGNGPLFEPAKARAQQLRLDINFMGSLSSDEIIKELEKARVFCLPSVRAADGDAEGFGIVVLEAMASGVPVITSAQGGAGEGVINGESGICFEEGNIEQLCNGLESLLTDNNLAEKYAKQGLQRVLDVFDNKKTTQHLEILYEQAMQAEQQDQRPG